MMPALAAQTSDLVIETWQPVGCGKVEKKVVAEVKEVTERPKETENEVVSLIKKAKALGTQPHILKVACEDYEALFVDNSESMDGYLMLKLIARLLKEKSQEAFAYRTKEAQKEKDPQRAASLKDKMIAVYGGAIHNDPYPEEGWEEVVFGPDLLTTAKGRYVEVDLYVPEYVEADPTTSKEKWYPLFKKHAAKDKVTLIQKSKEAYYIIMKRGVATHLNHTPLKKK